MILNFRLLAGLISLESILWELHFSASGPEGTLEFKLMGEKSVVIICKLHSQIQKEGWQEGWR